MPDREAACSCGQLQVTVRGDPVRVAMCHCLECQRRTGSTFGVQAFYPREQVRLAKGIAKRYARRADSGRTVTFNFWPECGGTVFWEPEQRPELIAVAVGCSLILILRSPVTRFGKRDSILGQPQSASNKLNIRAEGRQNHHRSASPPRMQNSCRPCENCFQYRRPSEPLVYFPQSPIRRFRGEARSPIGKSAAAILPSAIGTANPE
jgi:hypothetical protein